MGRIRVGALVVLIAAVVAAGGCADSESAKTWRPAEMGLTRYLPTLADVPGMAVVSYWSRVRDDDYAEQRRNRCLDYPEPGDPNGPQLTGSYWGSADRGSHTIRVKLWRTRPGENIPDEMLAWGARCATYSDAPRRWAVKTVRNVPEMPADAIQFDTTQTAGDKYWKPSDDGPDGRTVVVARDGVVLRVTFVSRGPLGVTDHDVAQLVNGFVRRAAEQAPDAVQASSIASWPAARLSALVMAPPVTQDAQSVQLLSQDAAAPGAEPADCSHDPLDSWHNFRDEPTIAADQLVYSTGVARVLREHDGFDGIAATGQWVKRCSAKPFVPEVCADKAKDGHLEAIPPVRIEGELVSGYQGVMLGESYVKTTKYCQPNPVVAQAVRVRGILFVTTPAVVSRAEGENEKQARERTIDEQRQQLAYVIHHARRAQ